MTEMRTDTGAAAERRAENHRRRVLKTGLISTDGHFTSMECLVRDISAGGARLHVESPIGIPDNFDLYIIAESFMRPAVIKWRHGNQIGVQFFERQAGQKVSEQVAELRARRTSEPFAPVPDAVAGMPKPAA